MDFRYRIIHTVIFKFHHMTHTLKERQFDRNERKTDKQFQPLNEPKANQNERNEIGKTNRTQETIAFIFMFWIALKWHLFILFLNSRLKSIRYCQIYVMSETETGDLHETRCDFCISYFHSGHADTKYIDVDASF